LAKNGNCIFAVLVVLNEVGDIHGHLVNAGIVELFNVVEGPFVLLRHKVDGDSFTTKSTATANSEKLIRT